MSSLGTASQNIRVNVAPAARRTALPPIDNPVRPAPSRAMLWTILFAIITSSIYVVSVGAMRYRDLYEEPMIAAHLARGHGFLTPLDDSAAAMPTSWCSPIYPYVMAGVYRVFGIESRASLNAMLALNALCLAAAAAALCVLGTQLYSRAAGIVAGVVVAIHPIFLFRTIFYWETMLALAMFAWLIVLALHVRRRGPTFSRMAILGAGLGVLALTNASYLFSFPLLVLLATWRRDWPGRLKASAVALLFFLIVLMPWTIRNYRAFGKIFFVRGGVNMEMWLANQPISHGWYVPLNHPRIAPFERERMLKMGESAYYADCAGRFADEYRASPSQFRWRSWNRFVYLFFGDPKEDSPVPTLIRWHGYAIDKIAINGPLLIFALAGTWTAWRLRYRAGWILPLALLAGAPFIVTYISYRYVMPTRLMLVLPASFLVAAVWERFQTGRWPHGTSSDVSV